MEPVTTPASPPSVEPPAARPRPTPRLAIVGGGQLARMTACAAAPFGCEVAVLERREDFPAQSLDTQALIGDWNDPAWLLKLAPLADVMTLENEFVSLDALQAVERAGFKLRPGTHSLGLVQDKLLQKNTFAAAGLALPAFRAVDSPAAVAAAGQALGWPLVLKARRNGYDGKGNATVNGPVDINAAWARLDGGTRALYVEAFCPFVKELAAIVVRAEGGETVHYPVVETLNRDHICHVVTAPAEVAPAIAAAAAAMAARAVAAIAGVGAFGIEMFLLADGALLLNEIAPRVHNTGHYTIEGCVCSQFENHVRAVLGWPLGSPALVAPAAAMVNLLGAGPGPGTPRGLTDALAIPGAHVHVYGKTRSERGRKMGHVTALGPTPAAALAVARRAAECIRFGGNE